MQILIYFQNKLNYFDLLKGFTFDRNKKKIKREILNEKGNLRPQ